MCIPIGKSSLIGFSYIKEKEKKHIVMVPKIEFERGDPNFVDERVSKYIPKKKVSFFDSLFGS